MQSEIGAGLVERIFGALNPNCKWGYLVMSSTPISSLVVQFFSVLSTKAAQILGVDFEGGEFV